MVATEAGFRVLVAEDEPVSRRMLVTVLERWGYAVDVAQDGSEAWELLCATEVPLLVLLDWMMPGLSGLEICRRLRGDKERPYSYLVMLTANDSTADLVQALEAGADDFLAKPFNHEELRVRLRAGQRIVTLQQELHRRGSYDDLTGLLNRRTFLDSLRRVHARAVRADATLGLAMVDVDHFKRINDFRGHQAGDAVLRSVASRIERAVRPTDLTCRYGGEEFVVAMPDCSIAAAASIGERLRAIVADTPIPLPESPLGVTVSVGISVAALSCDIGYDRLLDAADRALYRAKASGRNRVEICEPLPLRMRSAGRT